jgi:FAD/FMN-containing dehydrogenase
VDLTIEHFAKEVGGVDDGPVTCVGGRTAWSVGGPLVGSPREVRAPVGIVEYEPAEMVVRVLAGTTVAELSAALAVGGQEVPSLLSCMPHMADNSATVGGVLAVGRSGLRRLRYGPVRDTVLEAKVVLASGRLVKAGGPVVKNVSGYDLGRLVVGSLGTLGFIAEVVLRASPVPAVSAWFRSSSADPFEARDRMFRPSSILWDGSSTWVLLEGHAADVAAERSALAGAWEEVEGPPPLPTGGVRSLRPSELRSLTGEGFVAEVGVGTVHTSSPVEAVAPADPMVVSLNGKVKAAFDPRGRMNPGRRP